MRIISGKHKGRRIEIPPQFKGLRPTSEFARQAIFNILSSRLSLEGLMVADICAGTGAWGLEALSRGAAKASFVDESAKHLQLIDKHMKHWNEPNGELLQADAMKLPHARTPHQLVFIDPPYHTPILERCLSELLPKGWVGAGSLIIIEHDKDETIPLPPTMQQIDVRRYGRAVVEFLVVG